MESGETFLFRPRINKTLNKKPEPPNTKNSRWISINDIQESDKEEEAVDYESEEDERDLEKSRKTIARLGKEQSFMDEHGNNDERVQRFMAQYTGGDSRQYSASGGKMTSTGILVEDINDKFTSGDSMHLMKLRPPASSTPTDEELAEAWGGINNRQAAQDEFFSDPVVRFFMLVDGFTDNNSITKSTSQSNPGISLSDVYKIIASNRSSGYNGGVNTRAGPYVHAFNLPAGNAGLRNVAQSGRQEVAMRYGDTSVDELNTTKRIVNTEKKIRTGMIVENYERKLAGVTNTPGFTPMRKNERLNLSDDSRESFGNSDRRSSYGVGINPRDPSRKLSFTGSNKQFYEPSGVDSPGVALPAGGGGGAGGVSAANNNPLPASIRGAPILQNVANVPSILTDDRDVRKTLTEGEGSTEEGRKPRRRRRITDEPSDDDSSDDGDDGGDGTSGYRRKRRRNVTPSRQLALLAADPNNREAVNKFLSDARTVNAYGYMNRPEITGRLTLSPNTLAALMFAFTMLTTKFRNHYQGAEPIDFMNSNLISTSFAYYVATCKLYTISRSMNKVMLEKQQSRLLEERVAQENTYFSRIKFNQYTRTFVDISASAPPLSSMRFDGLYKGSNEMFNY